MIMSLFTRSLNPSLGQDLASLNPGLVQDSPSLNPNDQKHLKWPIVTSRGPLVCLLSFGISLESIFKTPRKQSNFTPNNVARYKKNLPSIEKRN